MLHQLPQRTDTDCSPRYKKTAAVGCVKPVNLSAPILKFWGAIQKLGRNRQAITITTSACRP